MHERTPKPILGMATLLMIASLTACGSPRGLAEYDEFVERFIAQYDMPDAPEPVDGYRQLTPLVRIPPFYPVAAFEQGLSGSCELSFDVSSEGVVDDQSISAKCTNLVFAAPARRSIEHWIFAPQIENGVAVPVRGETTTLEFSLEN